MDATVSRIGVLGGTFDPIHFGHLAAGSEVHAALGLDLTLVVPTATQPFKDGGTDARHRLEMCRLAIESDERFQVSDVDVARGGVTYTVDTLEDLHREYPEAELFFITGADSLATLPRWRDPARIEELCTLVGVTRPGHSLTSAEAARTVVEVPSLDVSSTDVRWRVASGAPIRYLVPRRVADYIRDHGLYAEE